MNTPTRQAIAERIHDLVLHELGEDVDIRLLLGPVEYARAVLSLCRSCGSVELARLAQAFLDASVEDQQRQRSQQSTRYNGDAEPLASRPLKVTAAQAVPVTGVGFDAGLGRAPIASLSYAASAVLAKAAH